MGRSNEATGAPEIVSGDPIPGSVDEKGPEFFDEKPAPDEIDPNTGGLAGVEKIEALTQTWTKPWLIAAYILIWVVFFVDSLQQQISSSLVPYVVSDFGFHGLMAATGIISNIVGGVSKLPLARVLDVIGRTTGLCIMLSFVVISLILMAVCQNVETYAAAQTFFWTGMNGVGYVLNIFMADTSTLKNRMILFGFTSTPYISNTFAGPAAAQAFLEGSTWRWGYGAFTIIIPAMVAPLIIIFTVQMNRAVKKGLYVKKRENRTFWDSVKYWVIELDVAGMLLVVAGFSLLLLPFSLAGYQAHQWREPKIIAMIVLGGLLLVAFPFYEKHIAPKSFVPFELFKNRTVLVACLLGGNMWISFYCYKVQFSSYLQVVYNLSVSRAGFITNIYNIVSCAWAIPVGLLMRYTDRYKWLGLAAVPVQILSTGLMIKFRMPDTSVGLVIMCEVLGALAGGTLVMVEQIAVMASVPHRDVAIGFALLSMITSVGGAIGSSISGAIWTNLMPSKLAKYLPDELKGEALLIYGDLNRQLSYAWGTPERDAIVLAYGETQKIMIIASLVALAGPIVWVSLMKNHKLSEKTQTKGVLF
ncbi:siderophore iron transporter [Colletotrichum higginsianum]|uniref:Siderophore iron transporter n=2 Tax=Colletotrichum higginsianum TaxID=80884 RepID=H1UX44_COLHI|nr:Siderophore iron transporter [Colletotrichum higginsianum IMI 349063]OBR11212.1 Siderophore iron transporter [Colletotrichum higginsianum IMI 349063]TIC90997.1 Siderophore iron transporter mirB [Colletotrichum higginsianum]CCF32545.1 siderophore iron transporter [Colletotrichum higginsianum]